MAPPHASRPRDGVSRIAAASTWASTRCGPIRRRTHANIAWVRETWDAIQPFVPGGVYVNELGEDEGDDRISLAYGVNYARLAQIKAKYDPENLFSLNANIRPAVTA